MLEPPSELDAEADRAGAVAATSFTSSVAVPSVILRPVKAYTWSGRLCRMLRSLRCPCANASVNTFSAGAPCLMSVVDTDSINGGGPQTKYERPVYMEEVMESSSAPSMRP